MNYPCTLKILSYICTFALILLSNTLPNTFNLTLFRVSIKHCICGKNRRQQKSNTLLCSDPFMDAKQIQKFSYFRPRSGFFRVMSSPDNSGKCTHSTSICALRPV